MTTFDSKISEALRTPQVIISLFALRGLLVNRKMAIETVLSRDVRERLQFDPTRGHELDQLESEIAGLDATLDRYCAQHPDAWRSALQTLEGSERVPVCADDLDFALPFVPGVLATFGGGE